MRLVAGIVVLCIFLGTACVSDSDGSAQEPILDPRGADGPVVVNDAGGTAGELGPPTSDAVAAAERLLPSVSGATNCGTVAADSGWPTTTQRLLFPTDCLVDAVEEGQPAVLTYTGRTGDGGALVTVYEARAGGVLTIVAHTIDAAGDVTSVTAECTPPVGQWSVGIQGGVVIMGSDTRHC